MAAVTVRQARREDVPALLRLYAQLNDPQDVPTPAAAERSLGLIAKQPGMQLLVAELARRVVGTATIVIVPNITHHAKPWAELENIVADEQYRRAGVGRALLARCEEIARAAGCFKVQLQSSNFRTGAHQFYQREGYQPSSVGFRRYF